VVLTPTGALLILVRETTATAVAPARKPTVATVSILSTRPKKKTVAVVDVATVKKSSDPTWRLHRCRHTSFAGWWSGDPNGGWRPYRSFGDGGWQPQAQEAGALKGSGTESSDPGRHCSH
jgi:hypothetical protein